MLSLQFTFIETKIKKQVFLKFNFANFVNFFNIFYYYTFAKFKFNAN